MNLFGLFKKNKKEDKTKDFPAERPQISNRGYLRGMYCPDCGYMEVNEDSNALPADGFVKCYICGSFLQSAWFKKEEDGSFTLSEGPQKKKTSVRKTGGHYRVRKAGPNIVHGAKSRKSGSVR